MTTLTSCWKVTRTDSTVFAFTEHDEDLSVGGVDYKSAIGFVPAAFERSADLSSGTTEMMGIIDSTDITASDLRTGKWDGARVDVIEVDWSTSTKVRTLLVGFLGEITIAGNQYSATLKSIESELQKPIGRTITPRCDAELGDSRCGYTLTADAVTVTSVTNAIEFFDSALGGSDGDYDNGKITWLTGINAGITADVKRYTASTGKVELYVPLPGIPSSGETASIFVGCDRTRETCRDTFSNIDNFRGFPDLPGVNDLIAGTQV